MVPLVVSRKGRKRSITVYLSVLFDFEGPVNAVCTGGGWGEEHYCVGCGIREPGMNPSFTTSQLWELA